MLFVYWRDYLKTVKVYFLSRENKLDLLLLLSLLHMHQPFICLSAPRTGKYIVAHKQSCSLLIARIIWIFWHLIPLPGLMMKQFKMKFTLLFTPDYTALNKISLIIFGTGFGFSILSQNFTFTLIFVQTNPLIFIYSAIKLNTMKSHIFRTCLNKKKVQKNFTLEMFTCVMAGVFFLYRRLVQNN